MRAWVGRTNPIRQMEFIHLTTMFIRMLTSKQWKTHKSGKKTKRFLSFCNVRSSTLHCITWQRTQLRVGSCKNQLESESENKHHHQLTRSAVDCFGNIRLLGNANASNMHRNDTTAFQSNCHRIKINHNRSRVSCCCLERRRRDRSRSNAMNGR